MKYVQLILCALMLTSTVAKAGCDFVFEQKGEEWIPVKLPAWVKDTKNIVLPTNLLSQGLGFKRMSGNGTPDGVWELCQTPNKLVTKYSIKNGYFDGVYEVYDPQTGGLIAKGRYDQGLRTGTWQMRDEDGSIKSMAFENGLPAEMMQSEDGRKALAFMKMLSPGMDAMVNEKIKQEAEKQGVAYRGVDDKSLDVNQGIIDENSVQQVKQFKEEIGKFREALNDATNSIGDSNQGDGADLFRVLMKDRLQQIDEGVGTFDEKILKRAKYSE